MNDSFKFHFRPPVARAAAFLSLLTTLARVLTAPQPFPPSSVIHAGTVLPTWHNNLHHQLIRREVKHKMKIDLTARELPATGLQPGVFADVIQGSKSNKRGKSFRTLTLVGELQATKSDGQRFIAYATYNLDDNRGVKHLIDDLKSWRGNNAIPDISQFDPELEFYGKPFVCDPTFADENGNKIIKLHGFRPDKDKHLTVSAGFKRANPQQQDAPAANAAPKAGDPQPASAPTAA